MGCKPITQCTKEELLAKIIEYNGNAYRAYTELNCPYSQYRKWCAEDPDFKAGIEEARKKAVQFVEDRMFCFLNGSKGDDQTQARMIQFFLKCRGNYSEKKEIVLDSKSVVDVNTAIDSIKQELENEPDK